MITYLIFIKMFSVKEKNLYLCIWFGIYIDRKKAELSGCSAVGSVLRSGRRGRQFESGHPDPIYNKKVSEKKSDTFFYSYYKASSILFSTT